MLYYRKNGVSDLLRLFLLYEMPRVENPPVGLTDRAGHPPLKDALPVNCGRIPIAESGQKGPLKLF